MGENRIAWSCDNLRCRRRLQYLFQNISDERGQFYAVRSTFFYNNNMTVSLYENTDDFT